MFTESRSSESLSRDGMIAVVSSVTVFIVASILFFTLGFLCGHFRICQKRRKPSATTAGACGETQSVPTATGGQSQTPYYDDVVLQQEVELKENIAYGPLR